VTGILEDGTGVETVGRTAPWNRLLAVEFSSLEHTHTYTQRQRHRQTDSALMALKQTNLQFNIIYTCI